MSDQEFPPWLDHLARVLGGFVAATVLNALLAVGLLLLAPGGADDASSTTVLLAIALPMALCIAARAVARARDLDLDDRLTFGVDLGITATPLVGFMTLVFVMATAGGGTW